MRIPHLDSYSANRRLNAAVTVSWVILCTFLPLKSFSDIGMNEIRSMMSDLDKPAKAEQVKKKLKTLSSEEKKRIISEYSREAVDQHATVSHNEYRLFLRLTDEMFPHLKICENYYYGCKPGLNLIFSVNALNQMIHLFQEEGKLKKAKALPLEDLKFELERFAKNANKLANKTDEMTFLVKQPTEPINGRMPEANKHITPVFVKVSDGKATVIITDSLGITHGGRWMNNVSDIAENAFPGENRIDVYKLDLERQKDAMSCPIFSLTDAKLHNKCNLFRFLEIEKEKTLKNSAQLGENSGNSPESCLNPNTNIFKALPPHFLKAAQSISLVYAYQKEFPHLDTKVPYSRKSKSEGGQSDSQNSNSSSPRVSEKSSGELFTIEDIVQDNRVLKEGNQLRSGYTKRRFFKYSGAIIENLLKNSSGPKRSGLFSCFGGNC